MTLKLYISSSYFSKNEIKSNMLIIFYLNIYNDILNAKQNQVSLR